MRDRQPRSKMTDHDRQIGESVNSLARRIARNSVWSGFAAVASPVLMFLFGGLTIRYVGLEAAGVSVVVASIFGVAARLTLLGVSESFVPRMAAAIAAADQREIRTLFGTVMVFSTVMSVATAVTIVGCQSAFAGHDPNSAWSNDGAAFILLASLTHVVTTIQQLYASVLRAAQRFDLLTAFTLPISFLTGLGGCSVLPLSPRLTTVGTVSLISAVATLVAAAALARQTVPGIRRPRIALGMLVPLVRYGAWITLSNLLSVLTASLDALMLAAVCGASAVAPYNVAKQLFITGHTMLLQQTEHIGPTLSALRAARSDLADRIAGGMLWLTAVLAAVGYSCIAWAGPTIVAVVAGDDVAFLSRMPILSYAAYGLAMSLLIVPVTRGVATGFPKLAFLVSLAIGPSLVVGIAVLGRLVGVPVVYFAPMLAIPALFALLGTTPDSLCDPQVLLDRLAVVSVPLMLSIGAIAGSALVGDHVGRPTRLAVTVLITVGMVPLTLAIEHVMRSNRDLHALAWQVVLSASRRFRSRVYGGC